MWSYLVIIYLIAYVIVIGSIFLSHIFTGKYISTFFVRTKDCKLFWEKEWAKVHDDSAILEKRVIKKIKRPLYLVGFYEFVCDLNEEECKKLWNKNENTISQYMKKLNNTIKAYYAYVIGSIQYLDDETRVKLAELMAVYTQEPSVHLRENSLKALYHLGLSKELSNTFVVLSEKGISHSEKLVSDGLCTFSGEKEKLAEALVDAFDTLHECYQKSTINFLYRENMQAYNDKFSEYLLHGRVSNDVQCSIVRLLGRTKTEEMGHLLADYINDHDETEEWEGMSVAANVLGNYERTDYIINTLLVGLTAKNWYIRMNSAKSLCKVGITKEEIEIVNTGSDVFAKNALLYTIVKEGIENQVATK